MLLTYPVRIDCGQLASAAVSRALNIDGYRSQSFPSPGIVQVLVGARCHGDAQRRIVACLMKAVR